MRTLYLAMMTLLFIPFLACSGGGNKSTNNGNSSNLEELPEEKQLNITILLDLSDRISVEKYPNNPEHFERDLANVSYFAELFVNDMKKRGTFMAKGKLKVIFSPKPNDPNVNFYAEKLKVDLSNMSSKEKKEIHDNLTNTFMENLKPIYQSTLENGNYMGSDIWRFFKNDVKDYCVERDSNYRNILVIITDGYIYHIDSRDQEKNRYAYLLPKLISEKGLRSNPQWKALIESIDFGLITRRNDLDNLEVMVLEVFPSPQYKNDEDIIKTVLANWFSEMNVKRYVIYNSDLPEYTKQRINSFIE